MATSRPSLVSCAWYTSPIPPAPMAAVISYDPSLVPGFSKRPCAEFTPPQSFAGWEGQVSFQDYSLQDSPCGGKSGEHLAWLLLLSRHAQGENCLPDSVVPQAALLQ